MPLQPKLFGSDHQRLSLDLHAGPAEDLGEARRLEQARRLSVALCLQRPA